MSVKPLPVLNPASTTRSPRPADSTPRAASHRESPAFGTQLQDARHRQSDAARAHSKPDDARSDKHPPPAATASRSAVHDPSQTNRQSSLTESDKRADPSDDSPASSVLGLIEQSGQTADSSAGTPAKTAADGKIASDKTPPDTATPALPVVATVAPPALLCSQDSAQPVADAAAADTGPQVAVAGSGALNATLPKSAGAPADADESDDADTCTASIDGSGAPGTSSFVLNAVSLDLAGTSHLFSADHAALSDLDSAAGATGSTTQHSGDASVLGIITNTLLPAAPAVASTAPHSLNLGAPTNSPTFSQELGQQVAWLSGQTVKQAQIRLNPHELGQIDVKLTVEHGRVDVAFMAQHPAAVVAVQHSLGQLNQMLGGHGLSLGHTSVGQQAMQHPSGSSHGQSSTGSTGAENEADQTPAAAPMSPIMIGLLDTFA